MEDELRVRKPLRTYKAKPIKSKKHIEDSDDVCWLDRTSSINNKSVDVVEDICPSELILNIKFEPADVHEDVCTPILKNIKTVPTDGHEHVCLHNPKNIIKNEPAAGHEDVCLHIPKNIVKTEPADVCENVCTPVLKTESTDVCEVVCPDIPKSIIKTVPADCHEDVCPPAIISDTKTEPTDVCEDVCTPILKNILKTVPTDGHENVCLHIPKNIVKTEPADVCEDVRTAVLTNNVTTDPADDDECVPVEAGAVKQDIDIGPEVLQPMDVHDKLMPPKSKPEQATERSSPHVTLCDIDDILGGWNESEDEDFSDDDSMEDPDFVPDFGEEIELELGSDDDTAGTETGAEELDIPASRIESGVTPQSCTSNADPSQASTRKKSELTWKKKNLVLTSEQSTFLGNKSMSLDILELETPYQFFSYLFPPSLIDLITNETNLYIVQKDPKSTFIVTTLDVNQFIGIVFYMSIVHMPKLRSYWSEKLAFDPIKNTMPVNKFEKIRTCLHFNNNNKMLPAAHPDSDRLFKVRPLVEKLNESFRRIPYEQHLCVDVQTCLTKSSENLKRNIPDKAHKWGYKIYVLSGVSGYGYTFEVETGNENIVGPGEPDLGASSNVVVRLSRTIPKHERYRLYFDSCFTSIALMEYLAQQGILSLGKVRRSRIANCKLPDEKTMLKKDRGYSEEYVADSNGVEITTVAWKDRNVENLASTFAGEVPKSQLRRYDKNKKEYMCIDRPYIMKEYNRNMGGVRLIDNILGKYKILLKSKRWHVRIFYRLLDLAMCNAWILYKKVHREKSLSNKIMCSVDFRTEVAEVLCKKDLKLANKRSSTTDEIENKRHKGSAQCPPPAEVRQDQVGHFPTFADIQMRCKFPRCHFSTCVMCEKCKVSLCLIKKRNCYMKYHMQ